ncbi:TetR/AcrR family transcriptional regulator [Staphylococcus cohnii]|uniref:TetR/AcrR family transcriptional regulator n=1 Tax=Staphylococcus cohnii TaxID=29382 RepID=UPI000D1B0C78|nr:TetR family transcriptional regulator C-terminal domain-containing protein [Staphylococcus cohnii]MBB2507022.1 HTH-type transcriptional regulator BetI [Staphylococcus cohnii subsp. barensis]MBZ8172088.1 TetR family transcriptional regulator [Staphylococcus cohnii]PTF07132.1 TetR family transcriptional regulator [Staphylococcus cohnii]PTG68763.1 TetR family transcriptional regulator [Staphylococcus cohnii]RIL76754.1 TetR family transcriptional regulator [Staphylococcus cohnii]
MPKIINHEKKKEQIIQYAFDSIVENGVKGSTVRQIAKLAEMTPGQIRYYFPNHSELLNAVMSTVELKIRRRIEIIFTSENLNTIDKAKASLLSVLPLDQERLADMEVWMAFRYDIHEYGQSTLDDGIDQLCNSVLTLLKNEHLLKDNLNIHLNSMKLHALIDGLALHKLLNPNGISNDDIQTIVDEEIVRLTQ